LGPTDHERGRIILEQKVISALSGTPHFPQFVACGVLDDYNYIIMEMLGRNLSDLRKRRPERRLGVGTVTRVGQQCIVALKSLHDFGFIHRDIKPSNLCIGRGKKKHTIYLVDFGMARRFRYSDGRIRRQRRYAGFRGTIRYVSVAVHERKEPGPVDDLWSLFYSITELTEGSLPWTDVTDAEEVAEIKNNIEFSKLVR
uniref:non-specific serine/threonine protein kinase n=1 Tax=Toxocara canis TaxID=6265 RepID=A0A183VFN3_TOXCA